MDQVRAFFAGLFDSSDFPARWQCGNWSPFHGWLYIASDVAIWLAYFIIPVILILFIQKRRDVPFLPVFTLFGAFIILCGTTHIIDVVLFWKPVYRVSALVRFATAGVSMITVFQLIKILPDALSLKSAGAFDAERERRLDAERELDAARAEIDTLKKELSRLSAR
jgi:hypothetical protein